ncbi:unnamed protein product [Spirodela intermedia]|uniref:Uncharacterized protein n=1 Tax=Spirodela intermedia TaxID=51605 RepID=A0A7I8KGV8_SPIIN|nr:unnamed protein product [Spirodela intermedia]
MGTTAVSQIGITWEPTVIIPVEMTLTGGMIADHTIAMMYIATVRVHALSTVHLMMPLTIGTTIEGAT